jgi:hypothetical protein
MFGRLKLRPRRFPADTGGTEARERAEEALTEMRQRHERDRPLMAWLRQDYERNHYSQDVERLFRGGQRP